MPGRAPSILIIIVDSARSDHWGMYGSTEGLTPYVDELADQAMVYTNANSPAGSTRPAMGAIFTGLYPQAYGFAEGAFPDEQHTTFAQRLSRAGYETLLFSNNPYVSPATGYDRGFERVCYLNRSNTRNTVRRGLLLQYCGRIARAAINRNTAYKIPTDLLADEAGNVVRTRRPNDRPLFLYLHLDVHHPYLSHRRYLRQVLSPNVPERLVREVERRQRRHPDMTYFARNDISEDIRVQHIGVLRAMYAASMIKADEQIRRVCSAWQAAGLWDNSLIVITSDHGECIGEHGLISHGHFPYEEAMRVPLVCKYPSGTAREGEDPRLVTTIDVGPTVCAIAEVPWLREERQGNCLLDGEEHAYVINQRWNFRDGWETFGQTHPTVDWKCYDLGHVIALKERRYKYVWTSAGKEFLFDLETDPGEGSNIAVQNAGETERCRTLLDDWRAGVEGTSGSVEGEYEEAIIDHLRCLGYVE
ncbi:MAG: sulfatase [Planctomycetes bacterium]|nr:sulfatase [Planctomycetota bacterium]